MKAQDRIQNIWKFLSYIKIWILTANIKLKANRMYLITPIPQDCIFSRFPIIFNILKKSVKSRVLRRTRYDSEVDKMWIYFEFSKKRLTCHYESIETERAKMLGQLKPTIVVCNNFSVLPNSTISIRFSLYSSIHRLWRG